MNPPLRIAFQSPFPPFRGGIATFSRYLLEHLNNHDSCQVEGFNYRRLYPSLLFPGKTQFIDNQDGLLPTQALVHSYQPFSWSRAAEQIARTRPDVYLYAHWHPFFCPAQLKIIRRLKKLSPSITISGLLHNVIPHESFPFQRELTHALFRSTDIPVVLSGQTQGEYQELGLPGSPVRLFHPVYTQPFPAEPRSELRHSLGISDNETALLFFGLIRPYKGLDVLLDALNGLDMQALELRLFIVGEFYTDKAGLLSMIRPEHRERIHVRDEFVSDTEAMRYLGSADVMMLPYKTASQSGILSNAINAHLPVICSDLPGLSEQVIHEKTGLLVRAGQKDELQRAILSMTRTEQREEMRDATRDMKHSLSWNRFAEQLLASLTK